jgi:phytoene dehydrogenase-like protein
LYNECNVIGKRSQNMKYDVIVVGGGLGGLTAGITAARRGRKTLLLEKHTTVGGLAAGFTRKGYSFDSGMSRCMGASVRRYLKDLGVLEKADLRPQRAIWNIAGRWIPYDSLDQLFDGLMNVFPEESKAIDAFRAREVRPKARQFDLLFADTSGMSGLRRRMHAVRLLFSMPAIMKVFTAKEMESEVLSRYIDRKGPAYAFLAEREDEVDYRGEMSFATKAGKWYTQMLNVYPAIGFQGLADALAAVFVEQHGEIRTSSPVSRILIIDGRAVGVEVQKRGEKETLSSENVICSMDLQKACRQLIGAQNIDADFTTRLDKSRLSSAIPILFLGVDVPPQVIRERFHGCEEVLYHPVVEPRQGEAFFCDHPMVVHSSCLHNPAHAPAGKATLQVYLSCPPSGWMDNWGIREGTRTERYRAVKDMVTEHVLLALERLIPELQERSRVEVCELGTPFTIERYTGSTGGCALGYRMDEDYIHPKTMGKYLERCPGIEKLYFAGQQAGFPGGVGTAFGSGKRAGELV